MLDRDPQDTLVSLVDYETMARTVLAPDVFDHIAGGAGEERSIRRTRRVLDWLTLRPRVLVDMEEFDTATTVLGQPITFPVIVGPSGTHGIAHRDAEGATVAAAGDVGTIAIVSSASTLTTEAIAHQATSPLWLQMYLYRDRGYTIELARRAEALGFTAICLTVDALARPKRERDLRNGYSPPMSPNVTRMEDERSGPDASANARFGQRLDPAADWRQLDRIREATAVPIVVKGILDPDDAQRCIDHGAGAAVVSAHGGRQLDTVLTPIEALPRIVERVEGRIEILIDGGFREGTDVIKAVALGARAVLLGRPILWGLAAGGRVGVRAILEILRNELEIAMITCGTPTVRAISPDLVVWESPFDRMRSPSRGLRP